MSHTAKLTQSRSNNLCLIVAPAAEEVLAWYFVRVEPPKMSVFCKEVIKQAVDLSDYGDILISGYGEQPPPHVMNIMTTDYGFQG